MAAAIRGFLSRADLLRQDQNQQAREALVRAAALFVGDARVRRVLDRAVAEAVRVVDRETATHSERSFIMLYPGLNRLVVVHLAENSKWPKVAMRLWAHLFEFARFEDGEVELTRKGMVEKSGATRRAVDGVLKELVDFGALIRLREPEPGKQGRGTVRYFINPRVGTFLPDGERDAAQSAAPRLGGNVVPLSAPPTERRSRAAGVAPVAL